MITAEIDRAHRARLITRWQELGIARCRIQDVLPMALWVGLLEEVEKTKTNRFAQLQAQLESKDRTAAKRFLRQWLGRYPTYDPTSVWAGVARELQPLADAYLEAPAVLRFYNLWETLPTKAPPSRSQLWHRDHEDTAIAKMFLYLSDVTEDAGPLIYATRTHRTGVHAAVQPMTFCEVDSGWTRSTDEQMLRVVPQDEWSVATGPIGTLVLADTAGYHKGGYSQTTTRWLATWEFTARTATEGSHFHALGPQP